MDYVFVVDDAPTLRALVTHMVRQLGGRPLAFESAEECLTGAATVRPDLVLMDLNLAKMRGDEACRELKKRLGPTPVVMMTASDDSVDVEACHQAGADDFLPKPIRLPQLASKLKAVDRTPKSLLIERRKPRHLVLYEPDMLVGELLRGALEYAGHDVFVATTPAEVLAHVQREPADLVVLGVGVAIQQMADVAAAARAVSPRVRLLKVSLHSSGLVDAELSALGITRVTLRGSNTDDIVSHVNSLLNRVFIDMRVAERRPFYAVAQFRPRGATEWSSGYTSDLTRAGLFLRTLSPLEPSSDIEVRLTLRSGVRELPPGIVVWSRPFAGKQPNALPPGMGVKFSQLQSSLFEQLTAEGSPRFVETGRPALAV